MKYTFSEKRNLKKIGDGYRLMEITLKGKKPCCILKALKMDI